MHVQLSNSVGAQGTNKAPDVGAIQTALQQASDLILDARVHPGPADGFCGVGTVGAIERFQRRLGSSKPDGLIDPNGTTLRRLNALLEIGEIRMTFPFAKSSDFPFHGSGAGMRAFGANRSNGRAHAGVDLYFPDFTDVLAMADGEVTRGPEPFYSKTFAIEIDHGSFVARYGEVAPESTPPVRKGDTVARGQKIGRVGILTESNGKRLNVPSMMLHFEMYDKTSSGSLTRARATSGRWLNGRPFFRRRDLIDPSGFVSRAPLPE